MQKKYVKILYSSPIGILSLVADDHYLYGIWVQEQKHFERGLGDETIEEVVSHPNGQTVTYGQIAQDLQVASAQAIGGAVGRNPWSILVPCHRVLGAGKRLTGYAAGVEKKAWLLEHEGVDFKDRNNRRRSTC